MSKGKKRIAFMVALTAALVFAAFVAVASLVFTWRTGLRVVWPDRGWQWLVYALNTSWEGYTPAQVALVARAMQEGAGAGFVVCVPLLWTLGGLAWRWSRAGAVKPMTRSGNDTFGHSDWATPEQARQRFSGFDPEHGCMVVAELRRRDLEPVAGLQYDPDPRTGRHTWGMGGKAELLTDPARLRSTHSLWFAGSGTGKTQSVLCTLAHPRHRWTTSYVGGDPKRELERASRHVREAMGHRVFALRPGGDDAINIFATLDPASKTFEVDVQAATARMFVEQHPGKADGEGGKWDRWGKMLVNALLADMLTDPACPPESRTPRNLRRAVAMSESDLRKVLAAVAADSASRFAREQAQSVVVEAKDTFSGIYVNAQDGTGWLSVPAYADLVSGDSFHPAEVCRGDMTVFIQVPPKALKETPAIARCLYGAVMDAVYEADGAVVGRVLFDVDEAYQLGRMGIMETVRDLGRSYRMTLRLWFQSTGQLEALYGREGKRSWYASAAYRVYAGVADEETAKEAMALCGGYTARVRSDGTNRGRSGRGFMADNATRGETRNENDARRELAKPEEFLQDWADDECLIYSRGMPPIRAGLPIAYRRADMAAVASPDQPAAAARAA